MTAYSELKQKLRGFYHDLPDPATTDTPVAALDATVTGRDVAERALGRKVIHLRVEADAAAGTTIAERSVLSFPKDQFPNGVEVKEIQLRTSSAVAESATVYATDTFTSRDKDGVSNVVAATLTTNTVANGGIGTTVAHKKYAATLSATLANRRVPPNGVLTLTRAKAGAGTQLPECSYAVVVEAL